MPTPPTRRAIFERLLAAFQVPQYRYIWSGTFLYYTGRLMAGLIMGWQALELTDSALWVGLVAGVDGAGALLFGLYGGVLADRLDRRVTLIASQAGSGLLLLLLGLLALPGWLQPWHLLAAAFLVGALGAVQAPAVGVAVYQVVERRRLLNASAAHMLAFTLARIGGAALGGQALDAAGAGPAYLLAAALMGASGLPYLRLKGAFRPAAPAAAVWQAMGSGLRYAWGNAPLRSLLLLSPLIEIFAFSYNYLLPVVARDVLGLGPAGLGWLSAAGGVGAALGVLLMAGLGDAKQKSALLMAALAGAGALLILFSLSRAFALSLFLAGAIGVLLVCYDILMQTLIQLLTSDEVRGRVFSLYTLGFGINALGGLLAGAVAAGVGAPLALGAAGAAVLGLSAAVFGRIRRIQPAPDEQALEPAA